MDEGALEWLAQREFEQPERRIALEEMISAIRQAQERIERLEQAIQAAVRTGRWPRWSPLSWHCAASIWSGGGFVGGAGRSLGFPTAPEVMGYVGMGYGELDRRCDQAWPDHQIG